MVDVTYQNVCFLTIKRHRQQQTHIFLQLREQLRDFSCARLGHFSCTILTQIFYNSIIPFQILHQNTGRQSRYQPDKPVQKRSSQEKSVFSEEEFQKFQKEYFSKL